MADKNVVDARGRSCPEPVILTKQALDQNGSRATVLVDNQVAVDNITRTTMENLAAFDRRGELRNEVVRDPLSGSRAQRAAEPDRTDDVTVCL